MPKVVLKNSRSHLRRKRLSEEITLIGSLMMRPCSGCVAIGKNCIASSSNDKCAMCVCCGIKCDLVVTESEWVDLDKERDALREKMKECRARISKDLASLNKYSEHKKLLRRRAKSMIAKELQNLRELDLDKSRRRSSSDSAPTVVASSTSDVTLAVDPFDEDSWFAQMLGEEPARSQDAP